MILALKPAEYCRQIESRRTAVRARDLARFNCRRIACLLMAGLTARELALAFADAMSTMACAAELDGGALTTRH